MVPRVSIGIPVFNGEPHLTAAVDSVLSQSLADLEVVIGDNASTDDTEAICRSYAQHDSRVRYFRHTENIGAGPNHNFVFERSTAQYFKWAAHDDVCGPDFLARCIDLLDSRPEVVLAFPQTQLIDDQGAWIRDYRTDLPWDGEEPQQRLAHLLAGQTLLHKCYPIYGLMRRKVLVETPLIAPYNSSDAVLLVEMALRGQYFQVPEVLFASRRHAASSLQANTTPEEVAAWFDPSSGGRFANPRLRLFLGYLRAINRVPMSFGQRLACHGELARWAGRDRTWRVIAGELKMKATAGLR